MEGLAWLFRAAGAARKFIREEAELFVSRFARIELVRYAPESRS